MVLTVTFRWLRRTRVEDDNNTMWIHLWHLLGWELGTGGIYSSGERVSIHECGYLPLMKLCFYLQSFKADNYSILEKKGRKIWQWNYQENGGTVDNGLLLIPDERKRIHFISESHETPEPRNSESEIKLTFSFSPEPQGHSFLPLSACLCHSFLSFAVNLLLYFSVFMP